MKVMRFIPAFLWMGVIFALSAQTGNELGAMFPFVERWFPWMDGFNFGHFVAYFILALLLWWGFASDRLSMKLLVVLLCVVYGASDEYHQMFVEGRHADVVDLRNDAIGAILAMMFVSIPFVRKILRRLGINFYPR